MSGSGSGSGGRLLTVVCYAPEYHKNDGSRIQARAVFAHLAAQPEIGRLVLVPALGLAGWFGFVVVTWRWLGSRFPLRARPRAFVAIPRKGVPCLRAWR